MRTYATFSEEHLGPGLALAGAGHAVSTTVDSLNRSRAAIASFPATAGADSGVECVITGDTMLATLGVVSDQGIDNEPGMADDTWGWRLDAGTVVHDGSVVTSGLPVPAFGQAVGLELDLIDLTLHLFVGRQRVYSATLTTTQAGYAWRFAVGLGSARAIVLDVTNF